MNIKTNVKAKIMGSELNCIKCHHRAYQGESIESVKTLIVDHKAIVLEDYKCEKCGCNTFDITTFIATEIGD